MVDIGKINKMEIIRIDKSGVYFDAGGMGEVIMQKKELPASIKEGDVIEVFVYPDKDDNLVATTQKPHAMVGEFALMNVVSVSKVGAFLDWGLPKDILVPFREQQNPMQEGRAYVVYVFVDEDSDRIVASSKLDDFLDREPHSYKEGDEVDLLIFKKTDLGYKAVINNKHQGVLYKGEVFQSLPIGLRTKGYIRKVRDDQKIDLILHKPGYEKVDTVSLAIIEKLKENNGFVDLNDDSPAPAVYRMFGISKKTFKKALGSLYKKRIITIEADGIRLTTEKQS